MQQNIIPMCEHRQLFEKARAVCTYIIAIRFAKKKKSIEQHAATSQCTTAAKRHMIVSNAARKTAPKMHTEKSSTMNTKANCESQQKNSTRHRQPKTRIFTIHAPLHQILTHYVENSRRGSRRRQSPGTRRVCLTK